MVTSLGEVEVEKRPCSYEVGGRFEVFHESARWGVPRGGFGGQGGPQGGGQGANWIQNRGEVLVLLEGREDEIREGDYEGGWGGRRGDGWGGRKEGGWDWEGTPSDSPGPECSGKGGVAGGGSVD